MSTIVAYAFVGICLLCVACMVVAPFVARLIESDGDDEENQVGTKPRSACAWCHPGTGATSICERHADEMAEEARLTREYGVLK